MTSIRPFSGNSEITTILSILRVLVIGIIIGITGFLAVEATAADALTYESCINRTTDEPLCKDCCDCLPDPLERKECRDACSLQDFSQNSDFITVDAPSSLGPNGDYSEAVAAESEQACKEYCDESSDLFCGDRRYCRDACNLTFSGVEQQPQPDPQGSQADQNGNDSNMSIDQAISDEAQMKTIAFDGLAFLTGDLCSDSFFPPGKVSDFFGFQYLRDITPNGFGHNTEFAGRISDSVLSILTDAQVQELVNLANNQGDQIDAYGYERFVLIKAFRRLLEKDLPEGATDLDKSAVMAFSADLYEIDAKISYDRAEVIGSIVAAMTNTQKSALATLLDDFNAVFEAAGEGGTIDSDEWPESTPVDLSGLEVKDGRVLVSTYATQLFSWYLGSVEGDTYFCPERHGTYFGSFYMKDIPPIKATGAVTINEGTTAQMGQAFLDVMTSTQAALVTDLVDLQRAALNNIVAKRQEIAEKLRLFMFGVPVDKQELLALVRQYGEYDGEIVYNYGTAFAAVGHSLTDNQADTVMEIRLDYYRQFLDYQANPNAYDCSGAWLYASQIDMPDIMNTDFLFGVDDGSSGNDGGVVADGAMLTQLANGFSFAEGPAVDAGGTLYFSDRDANRIYRWSDSGGISLFRENSGGPNGLFFDQNGNLLVCEGGNKQVVAIDGTGSVTVLADQFNGLMLNEPNDLWGTPGGGIYFTDPVYNGYLSQDGEHVYYLPPDGSDMIRVIDDMVRPNGIIGSADGSLLYVTDQGDKKTWRYTINPDGTLYDGQLFAAVGADGMTLDSEGNLYLCENGVLVLDAAGNKIQEIVLPGEQPTNVCFGGDDGHTLFITTRESLYSLRMRVSGQAATTQSQESGCLVFNPDYSIEIGCAQFNGLYYSFTLGVFTDSVGGFWRATNVSFTSKGDACLAFDSDLTLGFDCAVVDGATYGFSINYYPDLLGGLWRLDQSSVVVK